MKPINRRSFIKSSAALGGALTVSSMYPQIMYGMNSAEINGYFEQEFGIDDQLCRLLLEKALSRGGDFADLYFEHTISNWLGLEDGKVNRAYCNIQLGVGIRTVKDDQVGYGFTQALTKESMLSAAETAASLVNNAATPISKTFQDLNAQNYYPVDSVLADIPLSNKLPLVTGVNEKCYRKSPLIVKVNAGFHDSTKRIMVMTSDGVKAEDMQPRNFLYASVIAQKDGRTERAGWNLGGRHDFSYYSSNIVEDVSDEAVSRVIQLFDATQPHGGEMPVVLGPGVTGVLLHEAIGHGMEADFNRKNISTYSTMLGKKVAENFVTIVDDGTNMESMGAINIDDEGVPSQRTILVDKGILTSYLHDKISAKHYGVQPTGNGRRESFEHFPMPRMRNTYMLAGEADPEDVIKAAGNGIYVEDVSNGEVKIGEGDFAFYVSNGRRIDNGKLTEPIKDVNIMGNGPKMLANIVMLGNDLKFSEGGGGACGKSGQSVPVSFGQPTCLVKSMTVGGI